MIGHHKERRQRNSLFDNGVAKSRTNDFTSAGDKRRLARLETLRYEEGGRSISEAMGPKII
jgi:hypothetical protein